jgi:hypothetical protein
VHLEAPAVDVNAPVPIRRTATAEACPDHPSCIRFFRPDGAINEAGGWHAVWRGLAWHVEGPDPADAGFPMFEGVEMDVIPEPGDNPLMALVPYVGEEAVMACMDLLLPERAARG